MQKFSRVAVGKQQMKGPRKGLKHRSRSPVHSEDGTCRSAGHSTSDSDEEDAQGQDSSSSDENIQGGKTGLLWKKAMRLTPKTGQDSHVEDLREVADGLAKATSVLQESCRVLQLGLSKM